MWIEIHTLYYFWAFQKYQPSNDDLASVVSRSKSKWYRPTKSKEISIKFIFTDDSNFDKWCSDAHFASVPFYTFCNSHYVATVLHPSCTLIKYWCMSRYEFYSIILFISLFSKRVDLWQFLNRNGRPWANGGQFFPIFCNTSIGNGSDLPCLLLTIIYPIRVSVRISKNLSFYIFRNKRIVVTKSADAY